MANRKHLAILKQGVEAWNQWRQDHPDILPDLSGAVLEGMNLSKVNFSRAILGRIVHQTKYGYTLSSKDKARGANFSHAILTKADLSYTVLCGANFSYANLRGTDFSGATVFETYKDTGSYLQHNRGEVNFSNADLIGARLSDIILLGADFKDTNLSEAHLSRAYLDGINFSRASFAEAMLGETRFDRANLNEADFHYATMSGTIFADVDLSTVKGLDTVKHWGPSTIGINTVYASHGDIPEAFLKGAGVDDTFITYIRSLVGKAIEYYSCFISYSSKDDAFARRLYGSLQSNNVRCWFAPEDLKWGARIRTGIDEAIRMHDKLLLILSKHSVASGWVEREVKTALAREKKEKRTILFPVRVDRAVFDSPFDWATEIRHERNIGDFTRWKDHDEYEKAFTRLLRDLKAGA